MTKLKCGILPIQVEMDRFNDTKRELRTCKMCNNNEVEDEKHVLLKCSALRDVRDNYQGAFDLPEDIKMNEKLIMEMLASVMSNTQLNCLKNKKNNV